MCLLWSASANSASGRHSAGQADRRGANAQDVADPAGRAGLAKADADTVAAGEVVVRLPGGAVSRKQAGRGGVDDGRAEVEASCEATKEGEDERRDVNIWKSPGRPIWKSGRHAPRKRAIPSMVSAAPCWPKSVKSPEPVWP